MLINYFGHSYFLIEGNEYSIALDPFKNVGLEEIEVKADYVFCSHQHFDHNNVALVKGAKRVENCKSFEIIPCYHDEKSGALRGVNDVLLFSLDGFKIAFLGDLGEYSNEGLIDKLTGVDLLLIPVGGKYTIDENGAYEYAVKTKAKAVVPMHYKAGGSTIDIKSVDAFLNKFESSVKVDSPFEFNGQTGIINIRF